MPTNEPRRIRRSNASGQQRAPQPPAPAENQRSNHSGPKRKKRGFWGFLWRAIVVVGCIGTMVCCAVSVALSKYIVEVTQEDAQVLDLDNLKLAQTSILYDRNGNEYASWSSNSHRIWVELGDIPDDLKWAFICTEDKDFYKEPGVNFKRTIGAAVNMLTGNRLYGSTQGASTLEQQLIKNITGDDEQDAMRKVREIFRALGLCHRYSKQTILEAYLNTISLNSTICGVQAGAREYFGKDVKDCTLAECASIAAITKNPRRYNPETNPEELLVRRNDILYFMYQQGKLGEEEFKAASNEPLVLADNAALEQTVTHSSNNSYFADQVFVELTKDIMAKEGCSEAAARNIIYTGGLRVYTTVDPQIQTQMELLMLNEDDKWFGAYWHQEEVSSLSDTDIPVYNDDGSLKTGTDSSGNTVYYRNVRTQAAMTTMNYDGEVLAMVGGVGEKTVDLGTNRAVEPHQTGSTMKPIAAYSLALEYGAINYSSAVPDRPFYTAEDRKVLNADYCRRHGLDPNNIYAPAALANPAAWRDWPVNFNGKYSEENVLVPYALSQSLNTCAVYVGSYVGADNMYDFAKYTLNNESLSATDADYGPIVLGGQTQGLSTLELAASYQIFYDGKYTTPHYYTEVYDSQGNLYLDKMPDVTVTQAISEETATIMNRLLRNVLVDGTAKGQTPKAGGMDAVAKTGTATEMKSYTFVGLTPYYVTAVWWGCDKPTNMDEIGASRSYGHETQYIWKQLMENVQGDLEYKSFPYSDQVVQASYCTVSGLLAGAGCPAATGYYTEDNLPVGTCTLHG